MNRILASTLTLLLIVPAAASMKTGAVRGAGNPVSAASANTSLYAGALISPMPMGACATGTSTIGGAKKPTGNTGKPTNCPGPTTGSKGTTTSGASGGAATGPTSGNMVMGAAAVMKLSGSLLAASAGSTCATGTSTTGGAKKPTGNTGKPTNCPGPTTGSKGTTTSGASSSGSGVVVAISVSGLRPMSTHAVGIYSISGSGVGGSGGHARAAGSACVSASGASGTSTGAPAPLMLPSLKADALGDATAITTISTSSSFAQGFEVQVFSDASNHVAIGCGMLHTPTEVVPLGGMGSSKTNGVALITTGVPVLSGQVPDGTEVIVYATGLQPGMAQPNHIHAGACGGSGPVLFPLLTLVGDQYGRGVAGTAIPYNPALAGDSINIHSDTFSMEACGTIAR